MIRNDYAVTGSAGKKGGTGEPGFLVFGAVLFAVSLFGDGSGLYFFLAALIGRATGYARQEEDVKRKKQ
jgi:hypothetical protein